tara:strand:+ start:5839 stop:6843 length:1005 start_codon:yes stop_codon:yes gene_type:complete
MDKKTLFSIIKIVISLLFIAFIIFFFFGKNPKSLQRDLLTVDYIYVILSMIFGGWAYFNRGIRWIVLIEALGYKTSRINSISSVSLGYFTNLFIPRAGEITRCTALKKTDNIPVDKLFGTIIIERLIDFIFLLGFLILALVLKFGEIISSIDEYKKIETQSSSIIYVIFCILILIIFCIYIFRKKIKRLSFYNKVTNFIIGLKEGIKSIKKIKNKFSFWFHTVSIWVMYFLMTYICFYSIPATSDLGFSDGLFLLVLGGIGMVIPAPGGLGSYHLIVMIGLVSLQIPGGFLSIKPYNEYNPATLFPFIVHTAQTFVAVILGSIGMLFLFKKQSK